MVMTATKKRAPATILFKTVPPFTYAKRIMTDMIPTILKTRDTIQLAGVHEKKHHNP
jgi:hypothetical protein